MDGAAAHGGVEAGVEPRLDEVRDTQSAMNLDALQATRPIRRVLRPDEIDQVFDALVIRRPLPSSEWSKVTLARRFRDGINAYLKKFAFGTPPAKGSGRRSRRSQAAVDRILSSYITNPACQSSPSK